MNTEESTTPQTKILVVDDSPTARSFAVNALQDHGFEVDSHHNALAAAKVYSFEPDLILLDINLGIGGKGSALARALRKFKTTENIKIVLYSTEREEVLRDLASACGADAYMQKSTDPKELLIKVKKVLSTL